MAEKRMFTQKIVDSDAFLDMPLSSQVLYFHLAMRADDDGFVNNPKKITRYIGASEDDFKILLAKRFILGFESGVIVIKHWRMHNAIRKDRYHPTVYQAERAQLGIKENDAYTDSIDSPEIPSLPAAETEEIDDGNHLATTWQPNGNHLATEVRLGKDRLGLGKGRLEDNTLLNNPSTEQDNTQKEEDFILTDSNESVCQTQSVRRVVEAWNQLASTGIQPVTRVAAESKRGKSIRARIREYGIDTVLFAIEKVKASDFLHGKNNRGWIITFDWFVLPNNFPKVLEGNYDNRAGQTRYGNPPTKEDAEQTRRLYAELLAEEGAQA